MAGISNNEKGKTAKFFEAFSPFLCLKYRGLDNQNCLIPVTRQTGLKGLVARTQRLRHEANGYTKASP